METKYKVWQKVFIIRGKSLVDWVVLEIRIKKTHIEYVIDDWCVYLTRIEQDILSTPNEFTQIGIRFYDDEIKLHKRIIDEYEKEKSTFISKNLTYYKELYNVITN